MFPAELPVLRDVAIMGTVARQMHLGPGFSLRPPTLLALPAPTPVVPEPLPDALAVRIATHLDAAWPVLRAELIATISQQLAAKENP